MSWGLTVNGRDSYSEGIIDDLGFLSLLDALDGKDDFALCLWHYPDGVDFDDVDLDVIGEYLQTAGSSGRLTVEVREHDPEEGYVQYVLARVPVTSLEPSEQICWDEFSTLVHPEEVFTAAEAAPLFEQYYATGTIPSGTPRRRLFLD